MLDWVLTSSAMGTVALVFIFSVSHKLRDYHRFKASLGAYRIMPDALLGLVAPLVIGLEIAAIVAILLPFGPGSAIAFGLLLGYTLALAINLLRGNTAIDCGCGDVPTPISGWLLLRNGALLLLALPFSQLLPVQDGPLGSAPGLLLWLLVAGLVMLMALIYLILEQLLANHHLLSETSLTGQGAHDG